MCKFLIQLLSTTSCLLPAKPMPLDPRIDECPHSQNLRGLGSIAPTLLRSTNLFPPLISIDILTYFGSVVKIPLYQLTHPNVEIPRHQGNECVLKPTLAELNHEIRKRKTKEQIRRKTREEVVGLSILDQHRHL
jgi:hypothetical protein